jgi:uncharacterized SAM-binding protein YcdF (DUF218 family)
VKESHNRAAGHLFLLVVFGLFLAYLAGFVVFVGALPATPPAAPRADAIVALTGSEDRLDTAVALFEHGVGKRLLISGVHSSMSKTLLRSLLYGGRRFDCCADLGFAATNTHGNAMETAGWARANGFHSLLVVTANYHMPRSLEEFSAAMPNVKLVPYPVPEVIIAHYWWLDPGTVRLLHYEYAKYLGSMALRIIYPQHWSQPATAAHVSSP